MKLLLLCNKVPYPANDGSSIAIAQMIEGYLVSGIEVHVLCLNTKKHRKDLNLMPHGVKNRASFNVVEVDTNPTTRKAFFNLFQKLPFHVSRFYLKSVALQLEEILKKNTFDIIQFEGVFMMPYVHLVRKMSDAKVILRAHNVEHEIWKRTAANQTKPILKTFLKAQTRKLRRYELWCAREANGILAISEKDCNFFQQHSTHCITAPVGMNQFNKVDYKPQKTFFHLGAMDWIPNQQGVAWLVQEVWPLVQKVAPNLKLHLAGRTLKPDDEEYSGVNVVIHGEVYDASEFRKKHGIMLVPLQAGSGMRVKIVEAMAEGLPIITTTIGCEGIPMENGTHALIANTAEEFAQQMLALANDSALQMLVANNAAKLALEHFNNNAIIKKVIQFLNEEWK